MQPRPSAASLLAVATAVRDDTSRLLASVGRSRRRTTMLMAILYLVPVAFAGAAEAPEGDWYEDFGSFKICGEREYPKTFVLGGQRVQARKL